MLQKVLKMGEPLLLQKAMPVKPEEFNTSELDQLIEDLVDTQKHYGGVGIAAPQIGVGKQVVVIEYYQKDITRYANVGDRPRTVIINPQIEFIGEEIIALNEGCLSVPGLRGEVSRPQRISYVYYDQFGVKYDGVDDGFFARVLQHECDHLMGILYPMRMDDISKLGFVDLN